MKRIWKDYFTFSKKERRALTVLLLLMAGFIVLPYVYQPRWDPPEPDKALKAVATQLDEASKDSSGGYDRPAVFREASAARPEAFLFDPNTLTADGWQRLGIKPKTVQTLLHYREKGGRFRAAEDLKKIWGLSAADAGRLIPLVRIATKEKAVEKAAGSLRAPHQPADKPKLASTILDINTASLEDWRALPGIGEVLAARIIKYRERIGGFTGVAQVKRTYGISDSVFALIGPMLRADPSAIPKIDLNTVSAWQLVQRTGIPDAAARAIIAQRRQTGSFQSVDELKKIPSVGDSLFEKMVPFVKVN